MKKTARSILANLALIGLVGGGQTAVAQIGPHGEGYAPTPYQPTAAAGQPGAANMPLQSAFPAEQGMDGDVAVPIVQPDSPATAEGAVEMSPSIDTMTPISEGAISLGSGSCAECAVGPCCSVCGGGDCCPPNWYSVHEARILSRNWPQALGLAYEDVFIGLDADGNPVYTPQAVMTTRAAAFDVAAGYSVTIGRYLGRDTERRDRFLEFSFWGLNDWKESRAVTGERITDSTTFAPDVVTFGTLNSGFDPSTGAPSISFPFGTTIPTTSFNSPVEHSALLRLGGFNRADEQQISYHSDLNNFELNLRLRPRHGPNRLVLHPTGRWQLGCRPGRHFSYLFGIRVMSVDETFDWLSRGSFEVNGAPFSDVSAQYFVRTRNDLVGLQFGADMIYRRCKWSAGFRGKVGPYINFARMSSRGVTNTAGDPYATVSLDFGTSARKDDVAFIGEFGVVGSYSIRPNLALRASYDLMWVAGLALASEQITFQTDPPDTIDTFGLNFYQGLSLGFEWIW